MISEDSASTYLAVSLYFGRAMASLEKVVDGDTTPLSEDCAVLSGFSREGGNTATKGSKARRNCILNKYSRMSLL